MSEDKKPKKEADKEPKEKKAKKPLAPLSGNSATQYDSFKAALKLVIDKLATTPEVPVNHLRIAFLETGVAFREALKKRKKDPIAAKQARIADKIAKLQAQLAAGAPAAK